MARKKLTIKIDKEDLRHKPRMTLKASKRHKDKKNDYKRNPKHKGKTGD